MLTPTAALEAILFYIGKPIDKKTLAKLMNFSDAELQTVLCALNADLDGRGLVLLDAGNEVELRTAPAASSLIKKMREAELDRDLGKASMETLAIIAYQDGATRGEIDWVRGVNSSASLRTLLMRGLIEGIEDEKDKRRIRYKITTEALAYLGIEQISKLPRFSELSSLTCRMLSSYGSIEP